MAHRSSLVVASIVLSILALIWMSTMCLASIMYSYYRYILKCTCTHIIMYDKGTEMVILFLQCLPHRSDPDEHIKIERVSVR